MIFVITLLLVKLEKQNYINFYAVTTTNLKTVSPLPEILKTIRFIIVIFLYINIKSKNCNRH